MNPTHTGAQPPALPPGSIPKKKGKGLLLGILIGVGVLIIGILGFAALVAAFILTAKDIEITEAQKSVLVTAESLSKYTDIPLDPSYETLEAKQYFDRSRDIIYIYSNEAEGIYLDNTITIEHANSDAQISYSMTWAGLGLGTKIAGGIQLEEQKDGFKWGKQSKFALQKYDDKISGFAFIALKDKKIFFLDCWGINFDDEKQIETLLLEHLEKFDKESFK